MPDEPRLEPRRKLVCQECGVWFNSQWECGTVDCCGHPMVETYRDPAFLDLDRSLGELRRALAEAFRIDEIAAWVDRKLRRWRRTDA